MLLDWLSQRFSPSRTGFIRQERIPRELYDRLDAYRVVLLDKQQRPKARGVLGRPSLIEAVRPNSVAVTWLDCQLEVCESGLISDIVIRLGSPSHRWTPGSGVRKAYNVEVGGFVVDHRDLEAGESVTIGLLTVHVNTRVLERGLGIRLSRFRWRSSE